MKITKPLFLLFFIFVSQTCLADQEKPAADPCNNFSANNIIRVGSGHVLAPFHYFKEGKPTGLDIEIIKLVFAKAGFCFVYVSTPSSARSMQEMKQGRIDMLFSASYTAQRGEFSYFSIPYRDETIAIFWQPTPNTKIDNLTNLQAMLDNKLRGVINLGGYYGAEVTNLLKDKNKQLHQVNSIARRMKMLLAKRVDFIIEDEISGKYYLKQHHITTMKMHPYLVNQDHVAFMFSKKTFSQKQLTRINNAIKACKDDIARIVKRYKA